MRTGLILVGALVASAGTAYAASDDAMNMNQGQGISGAQTMVTPQMVIDRIHAIDKEEIAAGKMAKSRGTPSIQAYGETLVKDHQQADKDLGKVAKDMKLDMKDPDKVTWPADVATDMAQDKSMMDAMNKLQGADFDAKFLAMMDAGHQKALEFAQDAQANSAEPKIQEFLSHLQPQLQAHKKMADDLMNKPTRVQGRR